MNRLIEKFFKDGIRLTAVGLVRTYQIVLGPILGGACRFEPTCSYYAIEVLKTQKVQTAIPLIMRRLCRCHPFGGHGFDPAPQPLTLKERSFSS